MQWASDMRACMNCEQWIRVRHIQQLTSMCEQRQAIGLGTCNQMQVGRDSVMTKQGNMIVDEMIGVLMEVGDQDGWQEEEVSEWCEREGIGGSCWDVYGLVVL